MAQARVQIAPDGARQQPAQRSRPLHRHVAWGLHCRSPQRASSVQHRQQMAPGRQGTGPCRAPRIRVRRSRNAAGEALVAAPIGPARRAQAPPQAQPPARSAARDVVIAARGPGDQRRRHQGHRHRNHGRERLRRQPNNPRCALMDSTGRQRHRPHAHRVDVVQVRAL